MIRVRYHGGHPRDYGIEPTVFGPVFWAVLDSDDRHERAADALARSRCRDICGACPQCKAALRVAWTLSRAQRSGLLGLVLGRHAGDWPSVAGLREIGLQDDASGDPWVTALGAHALAFVERGWREREQLGDPLAGDRARMIR